MNSFAKDLAACALNLVPLLPTCFHNSLPLLASLVKNHGTLYLKYLRKKYYRLILEALGASKGELNDPGSQNQ